MLRVTILLGGTLVIRFESKIQSKSRRKRQEKVGYNEHTERMGSPYCASLNS